MVYIMGMQSDALGVKPTSLDELFESSTWKIKNIWDGVKLEIAPGDGCPVVLNSFTHLDPDLPVLEERPWKSNSQMRISFPSL
uniref:Ral guanine nucleotide dissociation stimulator n=1 Tax=Cyprinus carpio carpio TaxID=630221 RepID=A0A9J8CL11_CYPCA